MRSLIPLSLILTLFDTYSAHALNFPFHVRTRTVKPSLLRGRADIQGQTIGNTSIPVANSHNAQYISNITLGGLTIPVMLDTGRYVNRSLRRATRVYGNQFGLVGDWKHPKHKRHG